MSLIRETDNNKCWQGNRQHTALPHCRRSGQQGPAWHSRPFWKTPWQVLQSPSRMRSPHKHSHPKRKEDVSLKLVTADKKETQLKMSCHTHSGICLCNKRHKGLTHTTTWTNPENTTLKKNSGLQEGLCHSSISRKHLCEWIKSHQILLFKISLHPVMRVHIM